MQTEDEIMDEIMAKIRKEEAKEKKRREAIIRKGCPHTQKKKRIGTFTQYTYLECDVCGRQFYVNGKEIPGQGAVYLNRKKVRDRP